MSGFVYRHHGFTLFELLLVMSVVMAVSAMGVMSLFRLQTIFQLRSSADEVRSLLQYGRELSVSNKDQASYSISLAGKIFSLKSNGGEMSRFEVPAKVTLNPISFSWIFSPLTGLVSSCSPCQITFSSGGIDEVINVQENGLVN